MGPMGTLMEPAGKQPVAHERTRLAALSARYDALAERLVGEGRAVALHAAATVRQMADELPRTCEHFIEGATPETSSARRRKIADRFGRAHEWLG